MSRKDHGRFDPQILDLIPHREPMLLINKLHSVSSQASQATVIIDEHTPFFKGGYGVPAWIGLEYMGQTSALIAGYQHREGLLEPHMGFLMGSRKFVSHVPYFKANENLVVRCNEAALVGDSLATFNCTISVEDSGQDLATAMLSVFRRPL